MTPERLMSMICALPAAVAIITGMLFGVRFLGIL